MTMSQTDYKGIGLKEIVKCMFCFKVIYVKTYAAHDYDNLVFMMENRSANQIETIKEHQNGECLK